MNRFGDIVATIVTCNNDFSCLCLQENGIISVVSSKIANGVTWEEQCKRDMKDMSGGVDLPVPSIFRLQKVNYPQTPGMVSSMFFVYFSVNITVEAKKSFKAATGKFVGRLKWFTEADLVKLFPQETLGCSVLLELFPKITNVELYNASEYKKMGNFLEVADNIFIDKFVSNLELLVDASGIKSCQTSVFKEFIAICSPGVLMAAPAFVKYIVELGFPKQDSAFLFRSADYNRRKFLSFREFLYVLAVLDPDTNHAGIPGEVRSRYIFRFCDRNNDGVLNLSELRELVISLRKSKSLPVDSPNVEKDLLAYTSALGVGAQKGLSINEFLKAAGDLKIRGLSQVLRLSKGLRNMFQRAKADSVSTPKLINMEMIPKPKPSSTQVSRNYEVAVHCIRMAKSGTAINLEKIWTLKGVISGPSITHANLTVEMRKFSCQIHNEESTTHELLKNLRYLATLNRIKSGNRGNTKDRYLWGTLKNRMYATKLMEICTLLKPIFAAEPRLMDLKSPLYVCGDFHGNFGDLQFFERMFWCLSPGFCPCSILFLGDYVDRGLFSIEVITYLFCYKLLHPKKIYMLRGNHETRELQKTFTFYGECISKFGDKLGVDVWDCINGVFDFLPLAATIDGKLFCCHGGVPPPWLCPSVQAINLIPCPLADPDNQSPLAWELLWNDPATKQNLIEEDAELKANSGFAMNKKRGTAHIFNCDALEKFLNQNGFSHLVRAHEATQTGCTIMMKGRLVTIFSTSNYNNTANTAACLLVDNFKMRMMRLDSPMGTFQAQVS